jgi:glycosyltransferase involved in cell wall biosynthesis
VRILEVTPGYTPTIGGVERHVQAISEEMVRLGHEVVVATMDPLGEHRSDGLVNGVLVRHFAALGPNDAYRVPRGLAPFVRGTRDQFDVVHVHNYHAALIPLIAAQNPRTLIVTPHLNDVPHSRFAALLHAPYALLGRWAMRRADAVVCVSSAEQERVVSRLGVQSSRTVVIPNGVEERLIARSATATEKEPGLLLAVGRLQPYKRIEDAISVLPLLPAHYRLAVVGEGPHRQALERHAQALQVGERVIFAGRATDEDLENWFRRAHTVVNLSLAEAFGMTVLEAVAAGCQVVCSNIPAFRDLARQFPSHVTIADAPTEAARAAAILQAARRQTAPASLHSFSWRAIAQRLIQLFRAASGTSVNNRAIEGSNPPTPSFYSMRKHLPVVVMPPAK